MEQIAKEYSFKKRDSSHRFILGERKRTMTIRLV